MLSTIAMLSVLACSGEPMRLLPEAVTVCRAMDLLGEIEVSAPQPRTAVCQCQGYRHQLCFCLKAGIKCGCHVTKGSVWNLDATGRAVSKTGQYVNPQEATRRAASLDSSHESVAQQPANRGASGFQQQASGRPGDQPRQRAASTPARQDVRDNPSRPLPVVYAYTAEWCLACKQGDAYFSTLKLPFRIERVPEGRHPAWITSLPTYHWQDSDGTWRYWTDWRSLMRVWKGGK